MAGFAGLQRVDRDGVHATVLGPQHTAPLLQKAVAPQAQGALHVWLN